MKLKMQGIEGLLLVTLCCFMWGMEQQGRNEQLVQPDQIIENIANVLKSDSPTMIESLKELYDLKIIGVNALIFNYNTQTALAHVVKKATQKGGQDLSLMASVVEFLLSRGADPNITVDNTMVLHLAVEFHLLDIIDLLLKAGASPNWQNEAGETALHIALLTPKPDNKDAATWTKELHTIIKLFLLAGARISLVDKRGQSVAQLLINKLESYKKDDSIEAFDQFLLAVMVNDGELVGNMCRAMSPDELYIKINELDALKLNIVHYAVALGYEKIVGLLLGLGADWTVRTVKGDIQLRLIVGRILKYRTLSAEKRIYYKDLLTKLYLDLALVVGQLMLPRTIAVTTTFDGIPGLPGVIANGSSTVLVVPALLEEHIRAIFNFANFVLSTNEWGRITKYWGTETLQKYFKGRNNNARISEQILSIERLPIHPSRILPDRQKDILDKFTNMLLEDTYDRFPSNEAEEPTKGFVTDEHDDNSPKMKKSLGRRSSAKMIKRKLSEKIINWGIWFSLFRKMKI
jgi:Ankyrin repeats (3 copies)